MLGLHDWHLDNVDMLGLDTANLQCMFGLDSQTGTVHEPHSELPLSWGGPQCTLWLQRNHHALEFR